MWSIISSFLDLEYLFRSSCVQVKYIYIYMNRYLYSYRCISFKIMQVCFMSWQDIIPVITGNESLWHSHKIDAQWQNLCSKASTALGSLSPLPHILPLKNQIPRSRSTKWKENTDNHVNVDVPPCDKSSGILRGSVHFRGGGVTISLCSDSIWGNNFTNSLCKCLKFSSVVSLYKQLLSPCDPQKNKNPK